MTVRQPTMIQAKYYVHLKGAIDIRPCSRCLTDDAEYLHMAWLVKWPTLCARCYRVVFGASK